MIGKGDQSPEPIPEEKAIYNIDDAPIANRYGSRYEVPLKEDQFLFNAGHATLLYKFGLIDSVYEIQGQRYGVLDTQKILSNPRFQQNTDLQKTLLTYIDEELNQSGIDMSL